MRAAAALALIVGFFLAAHTDAFAEKRVALVIGNANYINATKLINPPNDATAVSVMLETAGFSVVETRTDLGNAEMRKVIRDFSDQTRDADVAVVYYAGHGIEIGNTNFLIPTDAKLERDIDVDDEAIALDRVLQVIEPARKLRLVILDACRDNPFIRGMKRTMATRAIGRGLAKYEPTLSNTLVAFAASPGSVVLDGEGANSPFTTALVKHITTPDLDLRIAFGNVRDDVLQSTSNRQEPYISGSLGGGTIALVRSLSAPDRSDQATTSTPAPASTASADASRDYERAMQVGTVAGWDAYLRTHTTGFYANLARAQRAKMLAAVTPPPAPAAPAVAVAVAVAPPQTVTRALSPPEPKRAREKRKETKHARKSGSAGAGTGSSGCATARRTLRTAMALWFDNRDGVITAVKSKCGG
jgi:uncharacterized caspase-like protein